MTNFMRETGPRSTHAHTESRSAKNVKHIEKRKQEGHSKLLVYTKLSKVKVIQVSKLEKKTFTATC